MLTGLLFELNDREVCNILPSLVIITAIDASQIKVMKDRLSKFIKDVFNGKAIRLSEIENPKLPNDNFDNFETKLLQSAER